MKQSYLVQQGEIKNRENKKGIDSIVQFAYMGAAEYEFGALGESLERIRENINDYVMIHMFCPPHNKIELTLFYPTNHIHEVIDNTRDLAENKLHLKCGIDFRHIAMPPEQNFKVRNNFFWDIQNDFMFWVKDEKFQEKFKTIISKKPE